MMIVLPKERPTITVDPPKHCRARCLRSAVAPLRSRLSSDGAKIGNVSERAKFFVKIPRKFYVKVT